MTSAFRSGVLASMLFAHAASASVVHHTNPAPGQPGHYDWHWGARGTQSWLDITQPASAQSNSSGGSSVAQCAGVILPFIENFTSGGAAVAISVSPFGDEMTRSLPLGAMLDGATFREFSYHAFLITMHEPYGAYALIPEGDRGYLGVLTADGRYGWIEVERDEMNLSAFAWAYETQPRVPITAGQVPAPDAAVLLALASITTFRRRRS